MKQMSGGSSIRRMGMKNRLKKIAVIGLSACLALGMLSGCSKKETFQADAAAITVNGDEISAGLVKFATHYSQALMESMYKMYMGVEDPMDSDIYGNGSTLGSMIKDDVVSTLERLVLAEQKMSDYNVELTDDEKAAVTEAATRFMDENGEEVLNQMGATQEVVERYLTLRLIQSKMEPQMSADVDTEVSDDEAAQRKIRYTLFRAETEAETESETGTEAESSSEETTEAVSEAGTEGETLVETEAETAAMTEEQTVKTKSSAETEAVSEAASEAAETETGSEAATEASETETETETETEDPAMVAAKAEALAKAEDLIAKVKDGEDFETASAEVDENATCSTLTFGSDSTSVVEGLITATEGLDDGTLVETPIEIDSGYYVAQVISKLDREATDKQKETIVEQRKSDRISELYTEWKDAAEITEDSDILAQITFDFSLTQETEASTEATTEAATEAGSESATEAATEAVSKATTEAGSEVTTEAATEAVETESESESETADKTESESETAAAK